MMDSEIADLLNKQQGKIGISQVDHILEYDPFAYHVVRVSDNQHKLYSKWGGCWEFEYKR